MKWIAHKLLKNYMLPIALLDWKTGFQITIQNVLLTPRFEMMKVHSIGNFLCCHSQDEVVYQEAFHHFKSDLQKKLRNQTL